MSCSPKKALFTLKPFNDQLLRNVSLRWSWNTLPAGAVSPKEGPTTSFAWRRTTYRQFQSEDFMPPENELKSHVDFIYEEGFSEKDQANYWKHFGKQPETGNWKAL